jgi:tRNA(adenine34) deaminase
MTPSDSHSDPQESPTIPVEPNVAHQDPMAHALLFAQAATELDEVPVGAVIITAEGQVIGVGHNRRESDQDPTAHAEIIAIRDAAKRIQSWRLEDCVLYVTLEPCPMCLGAIQQSRIKKVYYGAKDPKGGALSLGYGFHQDIKTHHRFEVVEELRQECGAILTEFFRAKRLKKNPSVEPNSTDNTAPQTVGTEPP